MQIATFLMFVAIMGLFIFTVFFDNRKKEIKLDKDTYSIYFKQLDKMIQYESIYLVDAKIGDSISQSNGASADIPNEDVYNLYTDVCETVMNNMSDIMKKYLFDNFGEKWIYDYIKIYSISMLINYTNLSITSITTAKK